MEKYRQLVLLRFGAVSTETCTRSRALAQRVGSMLLVPLVGDCFVAIVPASCAHTRTSEV